MATDLATTAAGALTLEIYTLEPCHVPVMAQIAASAHSHPMSEQTIGTCFGRFYRVLGGFKDAQMQGFLILHQLFEEATVMDICLQPSAQGKGFGKQLMLAGIEWLQTTQAEQLLLEVRKSNQSAITLYDKLGFKITGERKNYYKTLTGTEDAILMTLQIGATIPTLIAK